MFKLLAAAMLLMAGCPDRTFVEVIHNTGVPTSDVKRYAAEHEISYQEAVRQIGVRIAVQEWLE